MKLKPIGRDDGTYTVVPRNVQVPEKIPYFGYVQEEPKEGKCMLVIFLSKEEEVKIHKRESSPVRNIKKISQAVWEVYTISGNLYIVSLI